MQWYAALLRIPKKKAGASERAKGLWLGPRGLCLSTRGPGYMPCPGIATPVACGFFASAKSACAWVWRAVPMGISIFLSASSRTTILWWSLTSASCCLLPVVVVVGYSLCRGMEQQPFPFILSGQGRNFLVVENWKLHMFLLPPSGTWKIRRKIRSIHTHTHTANSMACSFSRHFLRSHTWWHNPKRVECWLNCLSFHHLILCSFAASFSPGHLHTCRSWLGQVGLARSHAWMLWPVGPHIRCLIHIQTGPSSSVCTPQFNVLPASDRLIERK